MSPCNKEVFDFLFKISDSNGLAKAALNEIAREINTSKAAVRGAIRKLLKDETIAIFKRPSSEEPAEFYVREASCLPDGLGVFKAVKSIKPEEDAAKLLAIAKELGFIELSIKDNDLVVSIAGRRPARSEHFVSYNEHVEIEHIIEDLNELIK